MSCCVRTPEQFGAAGDGVADDLPAFAAMISAALDNDIIQLGCRSYRLNGTLHINKSLVWCGRPTPHYQPPLTEIITQADTLGVRILRKSTFQDILFNAARGAGSGFHGLWCRASVRLSNVRVEDYSGHGIMIDSSDISVDTTSVNVLDGVATAQVVNPNHRITVDMVIATIDHSVPTPERGTVVISVDPQTGAVSYRLAAPDGPLNVGTGSIHTVENVDHWEVHTVRCTGNRAHGFYTIGPRSNAGVAVNLDCTSNYQSGVVEQSFLGNTYVACHAANNNRADRRRPDGTPDPWPSYNKPRVADSNRSRFYNCYSEGQAPAEVWYPGSVLAPGPGNWIGSGLAGAFDTSYVFPTLFIHHNPDFNNDLDFEIGGTRNTLFAMRALDNSPSRRYWMQYLRTGNQSTVFRMNYNNDNGATPFALTGERTADSEGPIGAGQFWMPNGFFFGNTNPFTKQVAVRRGSAQGGCHGIEFWMPFYDAARSRTTRVVRFLGWKEQIPADGEYLVGDRIFNASPAVGQPKTWVCTTAGGPGVFVFTSEGNL